MRKKAINFLLVITVGFLLVGCNNSEEINEDTQSNEEGLELTVWGSNPNFNIPIMEKAAELYDNDNVETINIEETPDYNTTLNTVLSSGQTEGLPNIVVIEDYFGKQFLTSYPESFVEITGEIDYSNFAPYKEELVTLDGKAYGFPFNSGVAGLFYRRDIFEEAGYDEDDLLNITWDEFIEIGTNVKETTGKNIIAFANPFEEDATLVRIIMHSVGEWYFDENGEIDLVNNEGVRATLTTLKELYDAELVTGYSDWNTRSSALIDNEAAAVLDGSWIASEISSFEEQSGLWGVTTVPRIEGIESATNHSNQGGSSWYVIDTGNEQENKAAVDFLTQTFDGNVEFYLNILENQQAITTYLPAQEDDLWETEIEHYGNQPIYKFFADSMSEIPPVSFGIQTGEAEDTFSSYSAQYYNEEISLDEFLSTLEDVFNAQFNY